MFTLHSHFSSLRLALVHTPGFEIERLVPWGIEHPLSFDVEYTRHLPTMQAEHQQLVSILKREIGSQNVYQVSELLTDLFETQDRKRVLQDMLGNNLLSDYEKSLRRFSNESIETRPATDLAQDMVVGYPREWQVSSDGDILPPVIIPKDGLRHVRDSVAVLPSGLVLGTIRRLRRSGDTGLMRAIFTHHPKLSTEIVFSLGDTLQTKEKQLASPIGCGLEGGNIQVLSEDSVAVGASYVWSNSNYDAQRYSFERAVDGFFRTDTFKKIQRIYVVHVPNFQHFWHLDSVFNMIGPKSAIAMPYVFGRPNSMQDSISVLVRRIAQDLALSKDYPTYPFHLPSEVDLQYSGMTEVFLRKDFERENRPLPSGKPVQGFIDQLCEDGLLDLNKIVWIGGHPTEYSNKFEHIRVALREQSSQAGNVFVIRPFWLIGFDQNPYTLGALGRFVDSHDGHLEIVSGVEQVKSEGGPHCLIADLQREIR